MAVISREELVASVTARLGGEPDDDGIVLLENLSDTLADYESRANVDIESERNAWEEERQTLNNRIAEVDSEWRRRYTERFNEPTEHKSMLETDEVIEDTSDMTNTEVQVEDLFTIKEE